MIRRAFAQPLLLFIALLVSVSNARAQSDGGPVADPIIQPDAMVKLAEHTYVIPDGNVGGVPNVGIVVGADATLVIDPGLGKRNGEIVLQTVAKVSDNEKLYIVSTHYHPEHTTGYLAFPDSAVYINSETQEREFGESGKQSFDFFANRSPVFKQLLEGAEQRQADITFEKDYQLDLGGVTVTMLMVGPTHTKGDTVFFIEQDKVLFSGDVVMANSFVAALRDTDTENWLAAFDTLEALGAEHIVPTHGDFGDGATIAKNREWFTQVVQYAAGFKSEHIPVDSAAQMITQEMTAKHPNWGRSFGINSIVRDVYAGH